MQGSRRLRAVRSVGEVVTLVITALVGVGLLAKGVRDLWLLTWTRRVGLRATGIVVGHVSIPGDGNDTYRPVVRFTDAGGVVRDFTAYGQTTRRQPPEGTQVPVAFLPDGSRPPQIAHRSQGLRHVSLFLWMGAVFLGAAILFAVVGTSPS